MNYKTVIEKAKKYCPVRIFSIRLSYGWWWGRYFYFFGKHSTDFAIIPMSLHFSYCTYEHGMAIMDGDTLSWSKSRQREKKEDEERHSHHLNSITKK